MRTPRVTVRSRLPIARGSGDGPMAVQRLVGVLEALSSGAAALSLSQLSRVLGIPKTSLFSLLAEMTNLGLVQRDEDGLYRQHGGSRRLGLQLVAPDSVAMLVRQALGEIASALGMTATLARLDPSSCALIYVDRWEVPDPVRFVLSYGQPLDLHCRAAGKLLVAHQPPERWAHWLGSEPYRLMTTRTRVSLNALAPELRRIARQDIAWSHGESFVGVGSCNVGVRGLDGQVLAALGVEAPLSRLQPPMEAVIVERLRVCAGRLSESLSSRAITCANLAVHV